MGMKVGWDGVGKWGSRKCVEKGEKLGVGVESGC